MSLFKRGNVWWSYFYEDGIRHQSSTGASNRRQAETIEAKLKEEVNNRRFQIVQTDPNMRFEELAARLLRHRRRRVRTDDRRDRRRRGPPLRQGADAD